MNDYLPFLKGEIEQSIPGRFEQQVTRHPDRVAVKGRKGSLTYDGLNRSANRAGRAILALRGDGEETVGLLLEKDLPLFAALFGILKAGKICVPLDPAHPRARAFKILEDAGAKLIVTDNRNYAAAVELARGSRELLNIDTMESNLSDRDIGLSLLPDALAYIVYTSGSTGEPKGVVQNHRNVLHNIMKHTNNLHISVDDRLTLLASFSTSQAMTDVYSALLNGASLCPFNVKEDGLSRLGRWLKQEEISIYHSSASIFRSLLDSLSGTEDFPSLRLIKLGSEQVFKRDVELYKQRFSPNCLFVNALSSTEAGTLRQICIDQETAIHRSVVPVGFPVEDMEILLLDGDGRPVGFDSPGEIVVKSQYLTPGYWRRPELTQVAFHPDPEGGEARIYHTGDLGRMSPGGCLEYLGRKDLQVKVRGFRVEVAEVEAALLNCCRLKQVAVVARQDEPGVTRLEAYVVPSDSPAPTVAWLRNTLKENLPGHMVPSRFFMLEELPLTPSGKVDRNSLHSGSPLQSRTEAAYVKPGSPLEKQIVQMWEELLVVRPIGVREDFFELGGDSLLAARMMDRVERTVPGIRGLWERMNFFDQPTIQSLVRIIAECRAAAGGGPVGENRILPLRSAGSRTPFFCFPASGADPYYFRHLLKHLDVEQPFFVVCDADPVRDKRLLSVRELAHDAVEAIRRLRPHGPYILGGHCFGGVLAFEAALQLMSQGEQIAQLVFFDVGTPGSAGVGGWRRYLTGARELVWALRRGQERLTIGAMAQHLRGLGRTVKRRFGGRASRCLSAIGSDALVAGRDLRTLNGMAMWEYTPRDFPAPIMHFVAADQPPTKLLSDRRSGWREFARAGLEVRKVRGNHNTMFAADNAGMLGDQLNASLSQRSGAGVKPTGLT